MSNYPRRYNPNRSADWNYGGNKWKLSRSKIELFVECSRCFYLDNKLGTKRPGFPAFTLNIAVDELLKREFDRYRKEQKPHPLMEQYGVDAVPFAHTSLSIWRDNFSGIEYVHEETGLLVSGAVDDIWINSDGELIVVDYKATSKTDTVETLADSAWEASYQRQMGVYQWLLEKNGFAVNPTGYFVYANASQDGDSFNNQLRFETTVVTTSGDRSWIDDILPEIHSCLESNNYPASNPDCEYCAYRTACGQKLQAIHAKRTN